MEASSNFIVVVYLINIAVTQSQRLVQQRHEVFLTVKDGKRLLTSEGSPEKGRGSKPTKILGLNAFHGDASAALVLDGHLVAALEEERLNRIKHSAGLPLLAAKACLEGGTTRPYRDFAQS